MQRDAVQLLPIYIVCMWESRCAQPKPKLTHTLQNIQFCLSSRAGGEAEAEGVRDRVHCMRVRTVYDFVGSDCDENNNADIEDMAHTFNAFYKNTEPASTHKPLHPSSQRRYCQILNQRMRLMHTHECLATQPSAFKCLSATNIARVHACVNFISVRSLHALANRCCRRIGGMHESTRACANLVY